MPRYIALLRGINVGGNKLVPMARLRALLEEVGGEDVATLLQSGNAVLTSRERSAEKLAAKIEAAIEEAFGFEVAVVIRTRDELAKAIEANPLEGAEDAPSRFLVYFLSAPPDRKKLGALEAAAQLPEELRAHGREVYARFPNGIGTSKLALQLGKLSPEATGRNWATVKKLLALADR